MFKIQIKNKNEKKYNNVILFSKLNSNLFQYIKDNGSVLVNHLVSYPTPTSLSYFWSFGSLAGIFLGIQMITGIILAMHYVPNVEFAFLSVEHIMRDVSYGWFIRYLHANGASMFFIVVYLHMGRERVSAGPVNLVSG